MFIFRVHSLQFEPLKISNTVVDVGQTLFIVRVHQTFIILLMINYFLYYI